MIDIRNYITFPLKTSNNGWESFNAICCHNFGHRPDRKHRGGLKFSPDGWQYNCFNCGFKAGHKEGIKLSKNCKKILSWLGLTDQEITMLDMANRTLTNNALMPQAPPPPPPPKKNYFMPPYFKPLTNDYPKNIEYLNSRRVSLEDYPFLVNTENPDSGIIIPCDDGGYVMRHFTGLRRYTNMTETSNLFGLKLQHPDWKYCLVFEGVFDAISLNGVAVMKNELSVKQIKALKSLNKQIIVVPDNDRAGYEKMCDQAFSAGFMVSCVNWSNGVKDVNDAVVKFGKTKTLIEILKAASYSLGKVIIKKRELGVNVKNKLYS